MKPVYLPEQAPGIAELQMENDLLVHENRVLRARLDGEVGTEEPGGPQGAPNGRTSSRTDRSDDRDRERLERAYYDLRWLVRRLNRSPLGIILRRWKGFRKLVDRYGRSGK